MTIKLDVYFTRSWRYVFLKILLLFHRYLSSCNYVFVSRMIFDVARFLCIPQSGFWKLYSVCTIKDKNLIYRCPCQFKNIIGQKNDCVGVILSVIPFWLALFYLQYLFCRLHFISTTFFVGVILSAIHFYLCLCQNNFDVSCDRYLRCIFEQLWLKCLPLFMADIFQLMSYLPIVDVRVAYPILSI